MAGKSLFPQQAWNTALTDDDATAQEELGILRAQITTDGGTKIYKYIQNVSGGALADGDAVVYTLTDDGGYVVTTIASADAASAAGIAIGAITSTQYGWVQVGGINTTAKIKGDTDATTAGALVGTSATAGKLGGGSGFGTSYAQDAVAADATGTVFLRGLI